MQSVRTTQERLTLPGPAGPLEALLERPEKNRRAGLAVVCHPHPQHGGTMQNKVAHTLARGMCALGLSALRFNFRGVGASAGSFGGGDGELEDALTVLDWGAARHPGERLWLAGFSFGGCIALRASSQRPIERVIAVAPAVDRCGAPPGTPTCPWVVVQGLADDVVDPAGVRAWAERTGDAVRLVELEGVDHFFHGRLGVLMDVMEKELKDAAQALPAAEDGAAS
jgi:alpha/beta superfamily hydrolase